MFGVFGKRKPAHPQEVEQAITKSNWGPTAAPQMAPPDMDGVSRIIPEELFRGEIGQMLMRVGITPDMPGNIAQTSQTFATLDAQHKKSIEVFSSDFNSFFPGPPAIKSMFLLPEGLWQGKYRNFLFATCKIYPADPTNVFFLAQSDVAEKHLNLPRNPIVSDQEVFEKAEAFVSLVGRQYQDELDSSGNEQKANSVAYETSRGLGLMMSVCRFEKGHHTREAELFGPLHLRTIQSLREIMVAVRQQKAAAR